MKLFTNLLGFISIAGACGAGIYGAIKHFEEKDALETKNHNAYLLVSKESSTIDSSANGQDYYCKWKSGNTANFDCQLTKITVEQTKKMIDIAGLKALNTPILKYSDLQTATGSTNEIKNYFLVKVEQQNSIDLSNPADISVYQGTKDNASSEKTPLEFSAIGKFSESTWAFVGKSNLVLAKLEDAERMSANDATAYKCYLDSTSQNCKVVAITSTPVDNLSNLNFSNTKFPETVPTLTNTDRGKLFLIQLDGSHTISSSDMTTKKLFVYKETADQKNPQKLATFSIEALVAGNLNSDPASNQIIVLK